VDCDAVLSVEALFLLMLINQSGFDVKTMVPTSFLQNLNMVGVMTPTEQKIYILNFIKEWAGSKQAALQWYESEIIPALNKTAQDTVDGGDFEAVKQYLEHISEGGFA
jgi:hypothetical protein